MPSATLPFQLNDNFDDTLRTAQRVRLCCAELAISKFASKLTANTQLPPPSMHLSRDHKDKKPLYQSPIMNGKQEKAVILMDKQHRQKRPTLTRRHASSPTTLPLAVKSKSLTAPLINYTINAEDRDNIDVFANSFTTGIAPDTPASIAEFRVGAGHAQVTSRHDQAVSVSVEAVDSDCEDESDAEEEQPTIRDVHYGRRNTNRDAVEAVRILISELPATDEDIDEDEDDCKLPSTSGVTYVEYVEHADEPLQPTIPTVHTEHIEAVDATITINTITSSALSSLISTHSSRTPFPFPSFSEFSGVHAFSPLPRTVAQPLLSWATAGSGTDMGTPRSDIIITLTPPPDDQGAGQKQEQETVNGNYGCGYSAPETKRHVSHAEETPPADAFDVEDKDGSNGLFMWS